LHGAELPRRGMARAAFTFCREHNATYRPHPSEIDKLSRAQHALWERRGITIDRSGTPLREHNGPVVAAFSTGVLEAAARGVPSFVHYPEAPMWLAEFWDRYGMKQWGQEPTPAPWTGADPAAAIRAAVMDVMGRNNG
ncbi:MAG: RNA-binding protein, partial [Pseudomonadota bacterium]|nr:RNA-binding protein [Pseudomonadota bacterium]